MGKETKIGLAVIGVLLTVFGVLLARHFIVGSQSEDSGEAEVAEAKPLPTEAASEEPNVVVAQNDPSSAGGAMWGTGNDATGEAAEDRLPSNSYMPPAGEPEPLPQDPYAEPVANESASAGTSPFVDSGAAVPMDDDIPDAPAQTAAAESRENPLRQLNAELPLDNPNQTAADDRYAETQPAAAAYDAGAETAPVQDPYAAEPAADVNFFGHDGAEPPAGAPAAEADPFGDAAATTSPANTPAAGDPPAVDPAAAGGGPAYYDESPQAAPARAGESTSPPAANDRYGAPGNSRYDPRFEQDADEAYEPAPTQVQPAEPADSGRYQPVPATTARNDSGWQSETPKPARPLPVSNGQYTVQPGDTLWSISEAVYGTGGYFKALAEHNRALLPHSHELTVGQKVMVPPVEDLESDYPSLCPKQRKSALVQAGAVSQPRRNVPGRDVYIVAEGDTLFDIARYELGKASRWAEIYELNRELLGEDFDYLRPGTELVMPPGSRSPRRVSRAAGTQYQR